MTIKEETYFSFTIYVHEKYILNTVSGRDISLGGGAASVGKVSGACRVLARVASPLLFAVISSVQKLFFIPQGLTAAVIKNIVLGD